MAFNSYAFVILFAITLLFYYTFKEKYKKHILLLSSAFFIGYAHIAFLLVSITLSSITYLFGKWIEDKDDEKHKSRIFYIGIILNILFLCGFKYIIFIQDNISYILSVFNIEYTPILNKIFLPLGISFYTFQAISYLIEVYWEEQQAERNYSSFMLYMLFFMKFVSGPIERPQNFLPQITKPKRFNYQLARSGLQLIALGLFKKMIIADRIAPHLDIIFSSVENASGAQLLIAIFVYPIQLYADFSAYTDMAIGGARILGYELSPNFNRPFIAKTITDFWRRWHISLSFWVRDYLYQPIAASRRAWKLWGVMYALLITFVLLGLWHGASWNFVIYGLIQGVVVCYEMQTSTIRNLIEKKYSTLFSIYSILRTYVIFSLSLLFFRVDKFSDVIYIFQHMFDGIATSYKELNLGINDHNLIVFIIAVIAILIYEYRDSKNSIFGILDSKHWLIRWTVYYALIVLIILCGVCDSGDFIYIQF